MFHIGCDSLANAPPVTTPEDGASSTVPPPPGPGAPPLTLPLEDMVPGSPLSPFDDACFTFDAPPQEDMKVSNITCFILMLDLLVKQVGENFEVLLCFTVFKREKFHIILLLLCVPPHLYYLKY